MTQRYVKIQHYVEAGIVSVTVHTEDDNHSRDLPIDSAAPDEIEARILELVRRALRCIL